MTTGKVEVVAACAVKWFQLLIDSYTGPPAGLRKFLARRLLEIDEHANEILAGVMDEIL